MTIRFSTAPGTWERHLRRRYRNPLFPGPRQEVDPDELLEAQAADSREESEFKRAFETLVQRAAGLPPTAESEQVHALKAELEQAYETAAGLRGGYAEHRQAIRELIALIMRAVRAGAAGDPTAEGELEREALAREAHFALLEAPLVADLLRPDSPVAAGELLPSLLSEQTEQVEAALQLFDPGQRAELAREARELLSRSETAAAPVPAQAPRILALLESPGPASGAAVN